MKTIKIANYAQEGWMVVARVLYIELLETKNSVRVYRYNKRL